MFKGSDYEFREFEEVLPNRQIPIGYQFLNSKDELLQLTRTHAMFDTKRLVETSLRESDFSNREILGFFADDLPGAVELQEVMPRFDLKRGCLQINVRWGMRKNNSRMHPEHRGQRFVLLGADSALPQNFELRMDYSAIPLDEASRQSLTEVISEFIMPSPVRVFTADAKLASLFKPAR